MSALKHRWFAGVNSMVLPSKCQKIWFFDILRIIAIFFHYFFFGRQKRLIKGWNLFWISSTTLIKTYGTWSTPPLHNLALSSCRSWFFKIFNCRLSTLKSNLGILMLSNCHEILDGGSTWCKEATVKISSKSDKVKGGKSIPHCMKWFLKMGGLFLTWHLKHHNSKTVGDINSRPILIDSSCNFASIYLFGTIF